MVIILKILSLFSGIGSFEKALTRLSLPYEIVGYSEIDSAVSKAYCMLHKIDESLNLGDIKEVATKDLPDFDLMTWGFPCQDISISNINGIGLKGERSGLYYEGLRILRDKKPKISIIENVDNLAYKNNGQLLTSIFNDIKELGYTSYWGILNAKDFGIPQNRKRIFIVSIRLDVDTGTFILPRGKDYNLEWWNFINPLETRKLTGRQQRMVNSARGLNNESINVEGVPKFDKTVITLRQSGLRFQSNNEHPTITAFYGRGGGNFTILAYEGNVGGITPRQCFKLMGFDYEDCDFLENNGIARTSLYAMAGNSIVVNILEEIFKKLIESRVIYNQSEVLNA